MEIRPWVERGVSLETRLKVRMLPGPDTFIQGDPDQLEEVLINLLRNAADAAMITGGGVQISWLRNASHVEIAIEDEGPGISNTTNLFVPFFTTKPGGSGIGLVLSRQIAEQHGGTLVSRTARITSAAWPACACRFNALLVDGSLLASGQRQEEAGIHPDQY